MMQMTNDDLDRLLGEEFAGLMPPVADDGFSEAVMARLRRRSLARGAAIAVALLVGLAIAVGPFLQIAGVLSQFAPLLADGWREIDVTGHHAYLVLALLLGLASPLLIRALEN